jgi:hypothetical protein
MQCPKCRADNPVNEERCSECGAELFVSSKDLVPTQHRSNLPTLLQGPQLPRLAAGVGAVAFGFGLELLRRNLSARATKAALQSANKLLPIQPFGGNGETLLPQQAKTLKLPKGYEIQETAIYVSRVIRRKG